MGSGACDIDVLYTHYEVEGCQTRRYLLLGCTWKVKMFDTMLPFLAPYRCTRHHLHQVPHPQAADKLCILQRYIGPPAPA